MEHVKFVPMNDIRTALLQTALQAKEAELLLLHVLKKDQFFIKTHPEFRLSHRQLLRFKDLEKRRAQNEPIAYILKTQPFHGREFAVNKHTLIPRPETELLIEIITNDTKEPEKKLILDIGTGSGCLGITLKLQMPKATVIASDISNSVLNVARKNARRLGAQITLVQDDLLGKKLQTKIYQALKKETLDSIIVVANLPYLPAGYKKTMAPDVTRYEPSQALFAGYDGLKLIKKLIAQIPRLKTPATATRVYLEIDPSQPKALNKIIQKFLPAYKTKLLKDLGGRNRYFIIFS